MRHLILSIALLASPAAAWEFSSSPLCTVKNQGSDQDSGMALEMTYDGATYRLTLTHPEGWPPADVFSMRFAPQGPFISTNRHQINGDSLVVEDAGFGNVLNGLQFNIGAAAILGDTVRVIDLTGAAPAIEAFRACEPTAPSV